MQPEAPLFWVAFLFKANTEGLHFSLRKLGANPLGSLGLPGFPTSAVVKITPPSDHLLNCIVPRCLCIREAKCPQCPGSSSTLQGRGGGGAIRPRMLVLTRGGPALGGRGPQRLSCDSVHQELRTACTCKVRPVLCPARGSAQGGRESTQGWAPRDACSDSKRESRCPHPPSGFCCEA